MVKMVQITFWTSMILFEAQEKTEKNVLLIYIEWER